MPVTTTTLLLAAVAGTAVTTVMQVRAAREQGKQQKALADYNVKVKKQEAEARRRAGKFAMSQKKEQTRRDLRTIENSFATGGVVGGVGTALKVEVATARRGEQDARMIAYNTEIGVGRSLSEAQTFKFQGDAAKRTAKLQQGTALFSGVTQLGTLGIQAKAAGII